MKFDIRFDYFFENSRFKNVNCFHILLFVSYIIYNTHIKGSSTDMKKKITYI